MLSFGQESQADVLLDYTKMRKAIMAQYSYLATSFDKVKLTLLNFYTSTIPVPITVSKNYVYLIKIMLVRGASNIALKVSQTGELRKKRMRNQMNPVAFDSDGSIQSADNDEIKQGILINRPRQKPYKESDAVRCVFCHISNR